MAQFIQITVMLTGQAAEAAGENMLEYALVPPATVGTLLELTAMRRPALAGVLGSCRVTIRGVDAEPGMLLSSGDEVVIGQS